MARMHGVQCRVHTQFVYKWHTYNKMLKLETWENWKQWMRIRKTVDWQTYIDCKHFTYNICCKWYERVKKWKTTCWRNCVYFIQAKLLDTFGFVLSFSLDVIVVRKFVSHFWCWSACHCCCTLAFPYSIHYSPFSLREWCWCLVFERSEIWFLRFRLECYDKSFCLEIVIKAKYEQTMMSGMNRF